MIMQDALLSTPTNERMQLSNVKLKIKNWWKGINNIQYRFPEDQKNITTLAVVIILRRIEYKVNAICFICYQVCLCNIMYKHKTLINCLSVSVFLSACNKQIFKYKFRCVRKWLIHKTCTCILFRNICAAFKLHTC